MAVRPTLKTVAAAAGVSTAQVSYAFNRPDRISAASRMHVLAVAKQLGYAGPDATGRSLRTGSANAIGVVFTVGLSYAFSDPYYQALLTGLAQIAEQYDAGLVLIPVNLATTTTPRDGARPHLDAVRRALIDGAVADGLPDDHPAVQLLAERRIPLVMSSASAGRSVQIDDEAAGRQVGQHLGELGHRNVTVVVASPAPPGVLLPSVDEDALFPYSRLRLRGIRAGLGPDAVVRVVSAGRNSAEAGRVAAAAVLDRPDRPTAIAADSDVLAVAVATEATDRGLRLGHDLSVTGFDDVPAAGAAGLTTVRQPITAKGRAMGHMLLDPDFTEQHVVLPTELVVRESTGPARSTTKGQGT